MRAAPWFALSGAVCLLAAPPALAAPCAGFTDVDDSSGFCTSIAWVKNRGITLGCTTTSLYCPTAFVTREQMAAFLYRLGFNNAFLQGGNAFGSTARIGTTDTNPIEILAGNQRVARFDPVGLAPAIIFGTAHNATPGSGMTIGGGHANSVTAGWGTIAGGNGNVAGYAGAVPGGFGNHAVGQLSMAMGYKAKANHDHCFVWGASSADTSCYAPHEVVMSGRGGFYFWTAGSSDQTYSGARLAPGTGAWAAYSDVSGKAALEPVDPAQVLERLLAMPVARWEWKAEPGNVKHMGPTAQDFRYAFGLGDSDKQIVTVDADGVALASIQGLNAKLEQREAGLRAEVQAKDAEMAKLRSESAELKRELAELRTTQHREVAELRLAVEVLMARTSAEGRVAQTR